MDPEAFVAIVVAWLTPLGDRAWHWTRYTNHRGEPVWVGGAVGLHVPRVREAS